MHHSPQLDDAVFWACAFWQEQSMPESKADLPMPFLPDEGAASIAKTFTALGHELTAEQVTEIFNRRL